jgi:hypothetical protein
MSTTSFQPPQTSQPHTKPHIPYNPADQIKADEEELARVVTKGIFFTVIIAASVGAGAVFGWYWEDAYNSSHPPVISDTEIREDSPSYRFINPIIFADDDKVHYPEFQAFDNSLDGYIASVEKKASIDSVSVYFRDLNSGHWTGINEDDTYDPANMLEVVVMMGYFNKASDDPSVLSEQIYYQAKPSAGTASTISTIPTQYYPPTKILSAGFYSVDQLLENMIIYCDTTAEKALAGANPDYINQVYSDFQLPRPHSADSTLAIDSADATVIDFMSARQYATLFRALYNGTYLSWNLSERAMQLLSMTRWSKGLVAGLDEGISDDTDADTNTNKNSGQAMSDPDATDNTAVAHKFGEHISQLADGTVVSRELHDCGVIYFPGKPYLLCVMTKGSDFPTLAGVISTISRIAYNYVDRR